MRLAKLIIATCVALLASVTTKDYLLSAQQPTGIAGLADDEEYMELMRHNDELTNSIDSLTDIISAVRIDLREKINSGVERTAAEKDSISTLIINLEQHIFDLRDERGMIASRINSMEQEWVVVQFNAPEMAYVVDSWAIKEEEEDAPIVMTNYRNLIDNNCFTDEMSSYDLNMLRRAHAAETEICVQIEQYLNHYDQLRAISEEYMTTNDEAHADTLFNKFVALKKENNALDLYIETLWHEIIDTKQYSYSYVLEKQQQLGLLDRMTEEFAKMQRQYVDYEDYYASNSIMHYATGHPTLLDTELSIARSMGLSEAVDSLSGVQNTLRMPEYRLEDLTLERRTFIDYEPIVFGKTTYYNNSNPIPKLKIYEYGTVYRILLGRFRSMQNLSIFKGVRPLYIDRDETHYNYYTGGFATLTEADEAAQKLRDKGFRAPQVCRWENGLMTNITKEAENGDRPKESSEPTSNVRYIVEITAESISPEIQATIDAVTPGKRISRAGNKFVVGTFVESSEANSLVDALAAMFTDLEVELNEISLEE